MEPPPSTRTLPDLSADCLLHIVRLAAQAAEPGAYLKTLLAVGGVCRRWRAATLDAPFDAEITWAHLRRFAAQVRRWQRRLGPAGADGGSPS